MGTTTNWQLPYPEPTDPVADGAAAIEALAEAVDVLQVPTKVYVGQTPAGDIAPAGSIVTASITGLPLGWYRISYTVLVSSGAAAKGSIRLLGASIALVNQFNSGAPTETWHMDVLADVVGAGTVNINIDNTGTAMLSTYSDPSNHQLWATPVAP